MLDVIARHGEMLIHRLVKEDARVPRCVCRHVHLALQMGRKRW